ncbi:MAG: hypothetical protein Q9208_008273 [Pyrenodesmia sp. 3 TL-2023]
MADSSSSPPTIQLSISVDPSSYSFADPHPPVLSVTLLSQADLPLTLFTWLKPLNPATGLPQDGFLLTDLSTSPPSRVPQASIRLQRLPVSRERGSGDDEYFVTAYPGTPVTISTGFATGGGEGWRKPQPRHVKKARALDAHRNPRNARRGTRGVGVDGLESGKRYKVEINSEKLESVWWKWGERDDILVEPGDSAWPLYAIERSEGNVVFQVGDGVEFEIL